VWLVDLAELGRRDQTPVPETSNGDVLAHVVAGN
jgi:hypothetical protein